MRITGTIAQLTVEILTYRTCQPRCDAVCGLCHINPEHISIISKYIDQRQLIYHLLKRQDVCGLNIWTIDGFQGQERKIILHNIIEGYKQPSKRVKPVEFIKFLAEPRRLNITFISFGNWSEWEKHYAAWKKLHNQVTKKFATFLTQLKSTESVVKQWNGGL